MGFVAPAFAAGPVTAAAACLIVNDYPPARVISISHDPDDDYTVMIRDVDGDLWECNSSSLGIIYYNFMR